MYFDVESITLIAGTGRAAGLVNAIAGGGSLISFPALVPTGLPAVTAKCNEHRCIVPGILWRSIRATPRSCGPAEPRDDVASDKFDRRCGWGPPATLGRRIDWTIALVVAIAALVGGAIGGAIASRVPAKLLRWIVIVAGLGMSVRLLRAVV